MELEKFLAIFYLSSLQSASRSHLEVQAIKKSKTREFLTYFHESRWWSECRAMSGKDLKQDVTIQSSRVVLNKGERAWNILLCDPVTDVAQSGELPPSPLEK